MRRSRAKGLLLAVASAFALSSGCLCCVLSAALAGSPPRVTSAPPAPPPAAPRCELGRPVSRDDLGAYWPLTVSEGCLVCEAGARVVFVHGGRRYAVNGTAAADRRNMPLDPIWADDPRFEGMKLSVGPLVGRGLRECAR